MEPTTNYTTKSGAELSSGKSASPCQYDPLKSADCCCKCALVGTVGKSLENARAVMHGFFGKNRSSRTTLLAGQFALALAKVQRCVPLTKGDVESLIRAATWHPRTEEFSPLNGGKNPNRKKHGKRSRKPWRKQNGRQLFHPQREVH